jgi:hypothetical protein
VASDECCRWFLSPQGFVPNAMWIVMRSGERYFFSSFLYRDNCYDLVFKLLPKRMGTMELRTFPAKRGPTPEELNPPAQEVCWKMGVMMVI